MHNKSSITMFVCFAMMQAILPLQSLGAQNSTESSKKESFRNDSSKNESSKSEFSKGESSQSESEGNPKLLGESGGSNESNLQGQRPKLEFERLRHDFGTMSRGEISSYAFPFQNVGDGVLVVRSIHASCGCVNTKVVPSDTFKPGESGRLVFEFDSSLFVGKIVRTITVDTNMAMPTTQTLTFTAMVSPEITITPNIIALGEVTKEFDKSFTVKVKLAGKAEGIVTKRQLDVLDSASLSASERSQVVAGGPLKVVSAISSSKYLRATVVSQNENDSAEVKVEFLGNLPIGAFRERVSLWNNSTHMQELVLPVVGEVVGHVRPSSKYIEFGVVAGTNNVRRSLSLKSDDKTFRVKSVDVEIKPSDGLAGIEATELFETKVERTNAGAILHFDMKFPKKLKGASKSINASGQFVLSTTDPDYKELKIPFFGVLRKDD